MKSSILISRISRVIETEGAVGEGVTLAQAYASAVRAVNVRLESVLAAVDTKQVSDAVRMMEDAPRLLDEVAALDFNQLPDWEVLCSRNGWTPPPKIDRSMLERALMLSESTDVVEPFLRMYRKAVRTNDNMLAVQSLRRLAELDHSQDWRSNLVQSETHLQKMLLDEFRTARLAGNEEESERLALDLIEGSWAEPPSSRGIEEVRIYLKGLQDARRDADALENVAILGRCLSENWNRPLVLTMLQSLDALVGQGWSASPEMEDIIERCRRRSSDELEAEEKDARWKSLCEDLHTAIQREDTQSIRDALSAPEFLDREPDEALIRQARLVIEHEEQARRRKVQLLAVCGLMGLLAVLGVSGWWLKQNLFDERCKGEAARLTSLQKGPHAVDRVAEALSRLEKEAPEVYADPRVQVFAGKLKSMIANELVRTNELAAVLGELRKSQASGWDGSMESITGRLAQVEGALGQDDADYRAEFLRLKASWTDHHEADMEARRKRATSFHETLVAHVKIVADRLRSELMQASLEKELASCRKSLEEWRREHSRFVPALEAPVAEAEKLLGEAENLQKNLKAAIEKLASAKTADGLLSARAELLKFYSDYPCVKAIGEMSVTAEDVISVLARKSPDQSAFTECLKFGVNEVAFKTFITDNVNSLADIPSYSALYGLFHKRVNGQGGDETYFAVCKGKPVINSAGSDNSCEISGELLSFAEGEMRQHIMRSNANLKYEPLLPSEEIKGIVDLGNDRNLTLNRFEGELLKLVKAHIQDGQRDQKTGLQRTGYVRNRFPAIRRVQLLGLYFSWLNEDLKVVPPDRELKRLMERIDMLAQPVRVDGVPEDLAWTCMREKRVSRRDDECADLLASLPENITDVFADWRRARRELEAIGRWEFAYAGMIRYDPFNADWQADHSIVLPGIPDSVSKDHPLYVLRRKDGRLELERAFVPGKNRRGLDSWFIAPGMTKELRAGEPLFQVSSGGAYLDAEAEVEKIAHGLPDKIGRYYGSRIPFFKYEVK